MKTNISVNMENLSENERKQLMDLIEKANESRPKLWKPREYEYYFFLTMDGDIEYMKNSDNNRMELRYSLGNCFCTRKDAEFALERLKVLQKLKEYHNPSRHLIDEDYCCLAYNYTSKRVEIQNCYANRYKYNDIYFANKRDAKAAIEEIGEEKLIKYYFCE